MDATSEVAERYLEGDRDLARRGGDVRRDAGQGRAPGRNRTGPGFGVVQGFSGSFWGTAAHARERTRPLCRKHFRHVLASTVLPAWTAVVTIFVTGLC